MHDTPDIDRTPTIVHVSLPADRPPWTPTGLVVEAGEQVTVLGSGFVRWSSKRDVGAGAKFHLWGRVPGGRAFKGTADTTTVTVDHPGELELCVLRGVWADEFGTLRSTTRLYDGLEGGLDVTVLRWPAGVDPLDGIAALLERAGPPTPGQPGEPGQPDEPDELRVLDARLDPALLRAEHHRLSHPIEHPAGWTHFRDLGRTDIFRTGTLDGAPAIAVRCDDDAGIVQRAVDFPLDPTTTIEWAWQVDTLPSPVAEDTKWTHDYVSIAVEFDSGRDLTWFWSAALEPVEATFACPMPGWHRRETHMPLHCGADGLGRPHRERRNVWEDHRRFMGEPPGRIVAVWLIAASNCGRTVGSATFADIVLRNDTGELRVL